MMWTRPRRALCVAPVTPRRRSKLRRRTRRTKNRGPNARNRRQEAILSLSLEGEGLLRMHLDGRVREITLARGTLFVMTGDARHKWKHELPPSGVAARRTALIVRPVKRKYLKKGRAPFSYE